MKFIPHPSAFILGGMPAALETFIRRETALFANVIQSVRIPAE